MERGGRAVHIEYTPLPTAVHYQPLGKTLLFQLGEIKWSVLDDKIRHYLETLMSVIYRTTHW